MKKILFTIILVSLNCFSCKEMNPKSDVSDATLTIANMNYLLYQPHNEKEALCMSQCIEDPVSASKNSHFAACGNVGQNITKARALAVLQSFVDSRKGIPSDADNILAIILQSPQSSIEDASSPRPEGFLDALKYLAKTMQMEGKNAEYCNAELHLEKWSEHANTINSLPNMQSSGLSEVSKNKSEGYYWVCQWAYFSFWWAGHGRYAAATEEIGKKGALEDCQKYAASADKYKYCKEPQCGAISHKTYPGKYWITYFDRAYVARKFSTGEYCDEWGRLLYDKQPDMPRAPRR